MWLEKYVRMSQTGGNINGFDFTVVDPANASNLKFASTESYVHAVWNQDDPDKGIFLSSSDDARAHFTMPKKIIQTTGVVKDVQIIAKEQHIVITIVEDVSGSTYIRAATGIIRKDMSIEFKPCEKVLVEGDLINVYTVFTETASEDHIFVRKTTGTDKMFGPRIDETTQTHCSRLILV